MTHQPIIRHLTFASDGRHVLFDDEETLRAVIRCIVPACRDRLLLYGVVDDHLHLVVRLLAEELRDLLLCLHNSLKWIVAAPLLPAHKKAVRTRAHLEWLVTYLLRQAIRHGLAVNPALWSGSCFPHLILARWIEGIRLGLPAALPRFRLRRAYQAVGLPASPIEPVAEGVLRALGPARLVAGASATLMVNPACAGNRPEVVTARQAVAWLGRMAGMPVAELAWALGTTSGSVRRHQRMPAPPRDVLDAVRRRIALEEVVARMPYTGSLA